MLKVILLIIDAVLFLASIFIALFLRRFDIDNFSYWNEFIPLLAPIILTHYVFFAYEIGFLRRHGLKKLLAMLLVINLFLGMSYFYLFPGVIRTVTPKTTLLMCLTIFYFFAYFSRKQFMRFQEKRGLLVKDIVIIGVSYTINEIRQNLLSNKEYKIAFEIGSLSDICVNWKNIRKSIDCVVIPSDYFFNRNAAFWEILTKKIVKKGVTVKTDFDFYEELCGRISDESVGESLWLVKTIAEREEFSIYKNMKRIFDIILSAAAAAILLAPFAAICVFIKVIDGYNPIFKQKRVGYLGQIFYIYKFRTMKPKKNENVKKVFAEYSKEKNEYGITGKLLRRFRLDEIPQIFNILKGDLSLVGPRPLWDKEYKLAQADIPNYSIRNIVRPGIAGWAQLNFRAVKNMDDCVTRFAYDVYYIKNKSFVLDMKIILKTIRRLFINDKKMG